MKISHRALALPTEGFGIDVEGAVDSIEGALVHAQILQPRPEAVDVRAFHRPEAAIAAAIDARADRAAAGVGDGAEAGCTPGDHDADIAPLLALDADAVIGNGGLPASQRRGEQFEQLAFVERTAAQLEIDRHVITDRRRGGERVDIVRARIDDVHELIDVLEIA